MKALKFLYVIAYIFVSTHVYSQQQQWVDAATYGSGRLSFMEPDGKGNYILAGYFGSQIENQTFVFPDKNMPSEERGHIVILKVDNLFRIISYNYITDASLQGMQVVNDHVFINFYAGINTMSTTKNSTIPATSGYEDILACFDQDLSLLWSKYAIDSVDSRTGLQFCGTFENKAIGLSSNIHSKKCIFGGI